MVVTGNSVMAPSAARHVCILMGRNPSRTVPNNLARRFLSSLSNLAVKK